MKSVILIILSTFIYLQSSSQSKITIGIVPFKAAQENNYYRSNKSNHVAAIEGAVTDAFINAKRFAIVERQKMDQIKSEKNLQRKEDFIDGYVIEQSKSLGAKYIVLGSVTKSEDEVNQTYAPVAGNITSRNCEIAFNLRVVDVSTSEIVASNSFNASGKGRNGFDKALEEIKPQIETFIKENFKVVLSVASVEGKNGSGEATKLLIAGGSSIGVRIGDQLKIFEQKELIVDSKKMIRKVTIAKGTISKVEDENFSICEITEGGRDVADKMENGKTIKCEILND